MYGCHIITMPTSPVDLLPDTSTEPCQRCKEAPARIVARKEMFCAKCFNWFMRGKQRKQMLDELYKVKYGAVADRLGTQRVLLALSFGVSSLVLLDMVASLLHEQNTAHNGKQGFELVVVHLGANGDAEADFARLAEHYRPVQIAFRVVSIDEYVVDPLLKVSVDAEFETLGCATTDGGTVRELLAQCASPSLRADLLAIVHEHLILRTAVQEHCQTVLYGHSMTRLAHEVIALTVQGRGLRVHRAVAQRDVVFEGQPLRVLYPLREILFAEVKTVLRINEHLGPYVAEEAPTSKIVRNMTVHDLTRQYFDNLDATGYASTASTVVKTAEKLGEPRTPATAQCQICGAAIYHDAREWLRRITVNTPAALETDEEREYARIYEEESTATPTGQAITACYGCTVTLAGAGKAFTWPVRATKQEVLDEYVLTDDET